MTAKGFNAVNKLVYLRRAFTQMPPALALYCQARSYMVGYAMIDLAAFIGALCHAPLYSAGHEFQRGQSSLSQRSSAARAHA